MNPVQILMMNQQKSVNLGYGLLYNWYAANTANFATSGWHLPTETEYITLKTFLGGDDVAGGKMKDSGYTNWNSPNTGATNSSGFTAYGSSYRGLDGSFPTLKCIFVAWLSGTNKYSIGLSYDSAWAFLGITGNPIEGNSVRLIKDSTSLLDGETSTMTDYDGNVYDTICIGTQEWIVQNWKCTHLNDGTTIPEVTNNTTWAGLTTMALCAHSNDWNNV